MNEPRQCRSSFRIGAARPPARSDRVGNSLVDVLAYCIVAFAGWTLAAHGVVLAGGSLHILIIAGPCVSAAAVIALRSTKDRRPATVQIRRTPSENVDPQRQHSAGLLFAAACITALLGVSWLAFWSGSICYLAYIAWISRRTKDDLAEEPSPLTRASAAWLALLCAFNGILTLGINRPDQDDAFYVGVAAFASGHPGDALLAFDPMIVERSWPLIFPSYRFASYELLAGAVAHATSLPALTVAHILFPPVAAVLAVLATFTLAQELRVRNPVAVTGIVLLLTIVLGETARSPANFAFDRLFQGKAVLLSVVLPTIYVFTLRHVRDDEGGRNLYVLACAYLVALGTSNFGMLIAPMAGITAAVAAAVAQQSPASLKRCIQAVTCAAIPTPYLLWVAITSHGGAALADVPVEGGAQVWASCFGAVGQYFIAFTLLSGPALATSRRVRLLTGVPVLLMLGFALNPLLTTVIARYLTTPPVFWRVTWQVPVLVLSASATVGILAKAASSKQVRKTERMIYVLAALATLVALAQISQFNTFREANGSSWAFGRPKLIIADAALAAQVIAAAPETGRLLAPDEISSILAMSEHHPPLVAARSMYIYMLRNSIAPDEYATRMRLAAWANGGAGPEAHQLAHDLKQLDVALVVAPVDSLREKELRQFGYNVVAIDGHRGIWVRQGPGR